jgi:hypothetical protein
MKQIFFLLFSGLVFSLFSQNYLHQVLILNEGYYDYQTSTQGAPVTIGSFNPSTQTYQEVSTINGMRFASDLIIEGNVYYVAADTKILKYDLNSHALLDEVNCPGVRNLAFYQGKLVATRGEYLTTYSSYLHVYDANNLNLITAIDTVQGPKWATQNLVIDGSKAYVAVNNGYEWGNEKGIIGTLDLNNLTYGNELDLGQDGKNPDNLMKYGNFLYTVNNKDWSGASVSKVALDFSSNSTVNLPAATGCGTSALRDDKLVYQISMQTDLNTFDIGLMNNIGPVAGHQTNYYELAQEPLSSNLYCTETDYVTFGKVKIFDQSNVELLEFNTGVAPGTVAFDVRSNAGLNEVSSGLEVYPNPASNVLNISTDGQKQLLNAYGQVVLESVENQMDISYLPSGFYWLQTNGRAIKIIKK